MTTVVSILMSDIIPLQDRGVWQGLINIIYAGGASAGAPLGGILADLVGWRWAFLGQAPLCLLAFVAVVFASEAASNGTKGLADQPRSNRLPWSIRACQCRLRSDLRP